MSMENERQKCQLPSCENRMSIKDLVLKISAREYITVLNFQLSYTLKMLVSQLANSGSGVTKSYDTSRQTIFLKLGNYLGINILRILTKPDFPKKILILIKKFKRAFLGTLCFLNFKLRTRFCSTAQKWQIIMRGTIPENFSTRKNSVQM